MAAAEAPVPMCHCGAPAVIVTKSGIPLCALAASLAGIPVQ